MYSVDLGIELDDNALITSKTDLKGVITYCNQDFYKYSGYCEDDVLHKPHNIVRHKDMPKAVFKLLWEYIQSGREIFAFVKNRAKDDRHYWVFANVTPSIDAQRNIIGYYSVRRKPNPKALSIIEPLYQQMYAIEHSQSVHASTLILNKVCQNSQKTYNQLIFELQRNS
ncbi:histidine kinase [Helicobacter sp. MIT 00-7814]|uniref:PAS domain-containing protein n=1 Tax=unclassified Helicobacter TaxID=2593540 RepID=UPI000E1EBA63|nr:MULTISPECIES: PAS domain-containing protein [unclassified Helicobacter]RDU54357.1 histidine kinase [Helicobacter sp. MIT 99-10781]RDU54434.1 histidine kinase [Helicobacter sp. MIT 00-7814]